MSLLLVPNPILPGCYPDASLCRRGDDYFLVTSSFGYWPGIPVFHSTDLVGWTQLGHVIERTSQLDLSGYDLSDGVWAPTIREHKGVFYVIVSTARHRQGERMLLFRSADPADGWSDPIELAGEGIDPSLFFDEGRAWVTACRDAHSPGDGPAEIWLRELDLGSLALVGPTTVIWHGFARDAWVEAPHLYRGARGYHLLCAEGGTERNHAVTAAFAERVTGPYRSDPRSPLLTHRHLGAEYPVQNVGHADLVDTPGGDTWAVVLATRPENGHHLLGRETHLVPVGWDDAGPVFAPGSGRVPDAVALDGITLTTGRPQLDRFDRAELDARWVSLRGPLLERARTRADGSAGLRLRGGKALSNGGGTPSFLGQRIRDHSFASEADVTRIDPDTAAGLALVQNEQHFVTATLARQGDALLLTVRSRDGGLERIHARHEVTAATRITFLVDALALVVLLDGAEITRLSIVFLSTESAGGFLGVLVGPYVESDGGEAEFRSVSYVADAAVTSAVELNFSA
ncbi:family 43 glycosylhydrolase [Microbacteriaceae bacterium VKM Ac-2854]|nr:family 43 glycosylhydrolase [Microbacteriaceae bacterium VKM Ac-2854]